MSRKPHQIAHNDVRFSVLPEHVHPTDQGLGSGTTTGNRQSWPRRTAPGSPELPAHSVVVGLYRTRGDAQCPNDVRVLSNGCAFFMTEAEYRRRECRPFFEELPWHEGHDGKPAGGTS